MVYVTYGIINKTQYISTILLVDIPPETFLKCNKLCLI